MRKMLSLLLSAVLLLTPFTAAAEELSSYFAGELTTTAVSDSYFAGNQLNLNAVLGMDLEETVTDETLLALARLLSKSTLHLSVYDDFGTARIHAELNTDGAALFTADALIYEDGSVQMMTSLTGKRVLALPAGGLSAAFGQEQMSDYNFDDPVSVAAFRSIPPLKRLMICSNDMISMVISHLLGWVSFTQMETGELYMFDDTYLDATESRDAVAQRMLGRIEGDSFNRLLWNVFSTVADVTGEFQLALAEVLADMGVTRYQARMFIDSILTEETVDPALDYVSTSYYIIEEKNESPIEYDDVSYFFKKLQKCVERLWADSTDNMLTMDVSYDDFGGMVGFDAHLAQFTNLLPYEGDFTYSLRTDDDWQRMHVMHGELQALDNHYVTGDLNVKQGEDVDGVNASHLIGYCDVQNQTEGTTQGVGVNANLDFAARVNEAGQDYETIEGGVLINARRNGEETALAHLGLSGMTVADAETVSMEATAALSVAGIGSLVADVALEQAEYEEIAFAGGQAFDLAPMTEEKFEELKTEIKLQAAKLGVSLVTKPDVLADLLTVFGKLAL